MPLTVPAATTPSPPPRRWQDRCARSRMPSIATGAAWARASGVSPLLKSPLLPLPLRGGACSYDRQRDAVSRFHQSRATTRPLTASPWINIGAAFAGATIILVAPTTVRWSTINASGARHGRIGGDSDHHSHRDKRSHHPNGDIGHYRHGGDACSNDCYRDAVNRFHQSRLPLNSSRLHPWIKTAQPLLARPYPGLATTVRWQRLMPTGLVTGVSVGTATITATATSGTTTRTATSVITVTSATTPDGAALYGTNCAGCHNPLATSSKKGRSATQIQNAINNNTGGMGTSSLRSLTSAQVAAIATALATAAPVLSTVSVTPSTASINSRSHSTAHGLTIGSKRRSLCRRDHILVFQQQSGGDG